MNPDADNKKQQIFFQLGFTPCKAEQPLQGMKLEEKEAQKDYRKSVQKEPTVKRCLLILDLNPLRSQVKEKHSIGREFQSQGTTLLTQTTF